MLPLIAGGLAVGGGLANYFANMSAMDRAEALQDKALQEFINIHVPDPKAQQVVLKQFVETGKFTPDLEQAINQAPSEFESVVTSASNKAAQNRALSQLEQIGNEGGLRLQDKAALQEAMMQGQVQDRGNRLAIQDEMARRGQGGSGFALQAQLQGQQAAGDRAARSGLQVASQAQDRALQAIMGSGDLAGKYRSQDFQEQSARAQAADAINKFNTQNLQSVRQRNVGSQNAASERNLNERQRISDQNTGLSNQEQTYNKSLLQQQFDNQMKLASGRANVYTGQAQGEINRGQAAGNLFSNLCQAGAGVATTIYGNNKQDERDEKNREFWKNYKG